MDDNKYRKPATVRREGDEPASQDIDWQKVYDEQQADGNRSQGGLLDNSAAKIGCGCVVPLLMLLGTCASATTQGSYSADTPAAQLGEMTGRIAIGALLCWAPLYIFWLREQGKWLIGASFAAVVGFFVLLGLADLGQDRRAMTEDISALSDIKYDADGNPILSPGMANKGPVSKLFYDLAKEQQAIRSEFDAEVNKAGFPDMMLAKKVSKNPALIQNCDRILGFRDVIARYRKRNHELIESAPKRIDELDISAQFAAEMKRGMMSKMEENLADIEAQWDLQDQGIAPLHTTCRILAKRQWQPQGDMFMFNNNADMQAFNRQMAALDTINLKLGEITKKRINRVKAQQDRLKSDLPPVK
jgi:hypothetical protein